MSSRVSSVLRRRLRLLVFVGLAGASAAAQQPKVGDLPFEELGKRVLDAADQAAQQPPAKDASFAARLAPLHERLQLGAIELWVPERTLESDERLGDGPRAKGIAPALAGLLQLERAWLRRMLYDPAELAACEAGIDELAAWARALRRVEVPSGAHWTQLLERLERQLLFAGFSRDPERLVVIVAPTRAHYLGVLGAVGLVDAKAKKRLWSDAARSTSAEWLGESVVLLPLCFAERPAQAPLVSTPYEPAQIAQWAVHFGSHLLSSRLMPNATTWWNEGIAVCDTIAVAGADETLCTGHAPKSDALVVATGPGAAVLVWVTREVSPFRGEASKRWFDAPLRQARTRDGFAIVDLDDEKPACVVPGPFLGYGFVVASCIAGGDDGVKRGFAEFYRAYCTAFVHWLDTRLVGDHSLLSELCRELAQVPVDAKARLSPLYPVAKMVTDRTLGEVRDATLDLEGEFMASFDRPAAGPVSKVAR